MEEKREGREIERERERERENEAKWTYTSYIIYL